MVGGCGEGGERDAGGASFSAAARSHKAERGATQNGKNRCSESNRMVVLRCDTPTRDSRSEAAVHSLAFEWAICQRPLSSLYRSGILSITIGEAAASPMAIGSFE